MEDTLPRAEHPATNQALEQGSKSNFNLPGHLQRFETKVPQDGPIPAVESAGCPYPQQQEISLGFCWPGASHQSSVFTHSTELNLT